MAWGKKLLLSLSVFAIRLQKRLLNSSKMKRRLPGRFVSLMILAESPAERGEQTLRCAQLSAQLSAELCSPDLSHFHAKLRCTESIHFLWPLNWKFSGFLVRPWISSAVADGTVFACLYSPVFSPSQVLGDVYTEVLEAASPQEIQDFYLSHTQLYRI